MLSPCYFMIFFLRKKKIAYFSKIYYKRSFQYSKLSGNSVVSTSQVRASAMLLLLILGSWELHGWGIFQWHKLHTKFHENWSSVLCSEC